MCAFHREVGLAPQISPYQPLELAELPLFFPSAQPFHQGCILLVTRLAVAVPPTIPWAPHKCGMVSHWFSCCLAGAGPLALPCKQPPVDLVLPFFLPLRWWWPCRRSCREKCILSLGDDLQLHKVYGIFFTAIKMLLSSTYFPVHAVGTRVSTVEQRAVPRGLCSSTTLGVVGDGHAVPRPTQPRTAPRQPAEARSRSTSVCAVVWFVGVF